MEKQENMLKKIKKIKEIQLKKRTTLIVSVVIGLLLIFTILVITDKNTEIFGGKLSTTFGLGTKQENTSKDEKKQRSKAVKVAIQKFKELGEEAKEEELEVLRIQRKGDLYYYISAKENTVEIRISDNKVTRVNGVPVEE